ncbi:MAG: hypothetical protein FWC13_06220 [Oscillospiraceae bacterium]|nr:hypothetical protein [Oscillospiraceae bacterium]
MDKNKTIITFITIIITLCLLTACSNESSPLGTIANSREDTAMQSSAIQNVDAPSSTDEIGGETAGTYYESHNNSTPAVAPISLNSPDGIPLTDRWTAEHGIYFVAASENASLLLHMTDHTTGSSFVLCPRPDCQHNSADCGAYLPQTIFESGGINDTVGARRVLTDSQENAILFADGEHIYASNGGNSIYRFNLDGSGRTEAVRIPDEYMISSIDVWLMNGKLYAQGSITLALGDENSPEFTIVGVGVVVEIDYQNGTVRELHRNDYRQTLESDGEFIFTTVFGLWDGKVFFRERHSPAWDGTDRAAIMANFDNERTTLFSIDPRTSERTTLHSAIQSEASEPTVMGRAGAVFHSRSQNAMLRLDLLTGETAVLAENIHGYIQVDRELGGRLLLEHWSDHPRADAYAFDRLNLLALNLATGEVSEITLRITTNMGKRGAMRIVREENGYFYIGVEQELERQEVRGSDPWYSPIRHRMGRIPIEDYFAGNAAAIELLGWYTANDWFTWERQVRGR